MPTIYAIGETIYDVIFKDDEPVTAKAGGSMLNTTVSLGRLGLPVSFVSEYGNDRVGDIIDKFLKENGINTDLVSRYDDGKTPIALAFLNRQNDANYSFYKPYPDQRLQIELPAFEAQDIILYGGFYSLMPEIREQLLFFVRSAKAAGATVIYDPNIRSPHKDEINELRELIYENLELADIVRGSDEDFSTIFESHEGHSAYKIVSQYDCKYLFYTKSDIGVEIFYPGGRQELKVPDVKTLSTIGAGDGFNAGLIYELYHLQEKLMDIPPDGLKKITQMAISFGSHVCTHYENYISHDFVEKIVKGAGY